MRLLRIAFAIFVGLFAGAVAFLLVQFGAQLLELTRPSASFLSIAFLLIASVTAFVSAAYYSLRFLWPKQQKEIGRRKLTPALMILTIAYAATWIFGLPAVHSDIVKFSINEYKHGHQNNPVDITDNYPQIRIAASFPLLPCISVTYHEYQIANLYGWGGWDFHLWYVVGVKHLFSVPVWIS